MGYNPHLPADPENQLLTVAIGLSGDHGVLPPEPAALLTTLGQRLAVRWRGASDNQTRSQVAQLSGCVSRLSGFLLQASRIRQHADLIEQNAREIARLPVGTVQSLALAGQEACTDFESSLFHARAALDLLAKYFCNARKQECDEFKRLRNLLGGFAARDAVSKAVLSYIDEAIRVTGTLIEDINQKNLRSLITHRTSIAQAASTVFVLNKLEDGRVLVFDCHSLGYPVLSTARNLVIDVPFHVLNSIASILGDVDPLPISAYKPEWKVITIDHMYYVDPSKRGPLLATVKFTPDGFEYTTEHFQSRALDFGLAATSGEPASD